MNYVFVMGIMLCTTAVPTDACDKDTAYWSEFTWYSHDTVNGCDRVEGAIMGRARYADPDTFTRFVCVRVESADELIDRVFLHGAE